VKIEDRVAALMTDANPVPDYEQIEISAEATAYLVTLSQRSSEVTQLDTNQKDQDQKKTVRQWWLVAAGVIILAGVALLFINQSGGSPVADQPTTGPVTFETEVDFSDTPYSGTFEVTVGADVLGCSSGTFVDMPDGTFGKVNKVMTCESGSNAGTFTIVFDPPEGRDWSVLESSDDFAGLQGGGDYSWVQNPSMPKGTETLTGDIEYTS